MTDSKKEKSSQKKSKSKVKLRLTNICKRFGSKVVLDGVDLDVFENESLVVLGGSGSGKSVLIKSIIGLLQPDSGTVELEGSNITNIPRRGRDNLMSRFGFLFQGGALFDSQTVWENVAFYLIHNKYMRRKEAQEIALSKLEDVGLTSDSMNLYPSELSGGMQKRVALARAIVNDPEVIFFDEPTTGLDPIMANVINDLIIKTCKKLGSTAITITHDINSAQRIATRLAMLYKGKIVWTGGVKKMHKSGNPIFDQFIKGEIKGPIELELRRH
jgi:phospholipid/cholesterol/gamma-HCH transport system ATP-binding protein